VKPLHVEYEQPRMDVMGLNMLPVIGSCFGMMSTEKRINMMAKSNAPKTAVTEDFYDIFGTNPYEITEVVPNRIWRVKYSMVSQGPFSPSEKKGMKMMGMDYGSEASEKVILESAAAMGPQAVEQAKKDVQRIRDVDAMIAQQGKNKETIKAVSANKTNMIVVKLNSGGLLLYCPVRVREDSELASWLKDLGPVKYVVMGSSYHTLQIPITLKSFPDAKFVGSEGAWCKLRLAQGFTKDKPEFTYNNKEDLDNLNGELLKEGIKFHFIDGDVGTQALVVIVDKTALEVDLIYSQYGGGFFHTTKEEWDKYHPDDYYTRLFKWRLGSKPSSPNNALPAYRFWMMDPKCAFSIMGVTPLPKDGSACTTMAESLRKLLREDIDQAVGGHIDYLTGEDFKNSIDMNWNWLDGRSLLF